MHEYNNILKKYHEQLTSQRPDDLKTSDTARFSEVVIGINSAILSRNTLRDRYNFARGQFVTPRRQEVSHIMGDSFLHLHFHRKQLVVDPPRIYGRLYVFLQP